MKEHTSYTHGKLKKKKKKKPYLYVFIRQAHESIHFLEKNVSQQLTFSLLLCVSFIKI